MIRSSTLHPTPPLQPWPASVPPMERPTWNAFETTAPSVLDLRGAEIALTVHTVMGECRTLIGTGFEERPRDPSRQPPAGTG